MFFDLYVYLTFGQVTTRESTVN